MKYIIGYTSYEYVIGGIRIPKKSTSRSDQPGNLGVTAVTEEQLKTLEATKLFQRLVEAKSIKVLDTRPSWSVTSTEKIDTLQQENAKLRAELEESRKLKATPDKSEQPKVSPKENSHIGATRPREKE